MAAVGADAVAEHFGVDLGAARLGMFEFFEHQDAGPFGEDEAVAIAVERAAGPRSESSLRSERARMLAKPLMPIGRDRRFGAAGDHHVGVVVLNGLKASPMALAALAQAVATAAFGPRRPY